MIVGAVWLLLRFDVFPKDWLDVLDAYWFGVRVGFNCVQKVDGILEGRVDAVALDEDFASLFRVAGDALFLPFELGEFIVRFVN